MSNEGTRAQLITLEGADVPLVRYSSSAALDGGLTRALDDQAARAPGLVIGPGRSATLRIGRPAPDQAPQRLVAAPLQGVRAALAGLAWRLLALARRLGAVSSDVRDCTTSAVRSIGARSQGPSRLLATLRSCARAPTTSPPTATGVRERLASVLSPHAFARALTIARRDPARRAVLTVPGSAPAPVDPAIRIVLPSLGAVPGGSRTVVHIGASGGVAPYRFYILREGLPAVPSWVRLYPDGTLTIEPPERASLQVTLTVYAVDAEGNSSVNL